MKRLQCIFCDKPYVGYYEAKLLQRLVSGEALGAKELSTEMAGIKPHSSNTYTPLVHQYIRPLIELGLVDKIPRSSRPYKPISFIITKAGTKLASKLPHNLDNKVSKDSRLHLWGRG